MQKVQVRFCGWGQDWTLGTVADNGSQLLFEYSPEALMKGVEFSRLRMPLQAEAYGDYPQHQFRLPGLIADALPDGWGVLLMDRFFRKHFGKGPHDISPLDRLAFIGGRAMGALSFVPATDIGLTDPDMQLLELAQEMKKVIADKESAALKQLVLVGGSPHGARPKALVQYDTESRVVSTLETAAGQPWLVKFPSRNEHKEVCAIEYLYSEMARQCELDMPPTRHFDIDARTAAFGIERFDRFEGKRVPIHTLAGALDLNFREPNTSYQTLLRTTRALTHSEAEVRKAYERSVFNVVFNNRDDHTKNFSFRMDESLSWKLSPCYDLTYCRGPGGEHQMDVEGEGRHPGKVHLLRLADTNSLDLAWAQDLIEKIVAVALRFRKAAKDYPMRPATRAEIARAIEANCARMA
jgi:serine/threonine-protein kinase HipA